MITFVAPGNPFGGPTRVAMNHRDELVQRGHEVTLVAAQPPVGRRGGWSSVSLGVRGFDARNVIPGAGFSGLIAPTLLLFGHANLGQYDVIHVHVSRDLITLPLALQARRQHVPYVLQPHGMVDRSSKISASILDALVTRRVFGGASRVLALTEHERDELLAAMPRTLLDVELLPNGVPLTDSPSHAAAEIPEVLFCARLHARKRPVAFAEMSRELIRRGVAATFVMIGPDEGDADAVRTVAADPVTRGALRLEGAIDPDLVLERLRGASVLVLPSVDEPFPMIVLEAMSVGLPVVVTDSCGLAPLVAQHDAGIVVASDDPVALRAAVDTLIARPQLRTEMGQRGRTAVQADLGMDRVVDRLEQIYRRVCDDRSTMSVSTLPAP